MSRRERRNIGSENNFSKITVWAIILIAVITFALAYTLYSRKLQNQKISSLENTQNGGETNNRKMINMINNNEVENTTLASSSIGKTVNELENVISNNEVEKMAVNTSNAENSTKNSEENNKEENYIDKSTNTQKTESLNVEIEQEVQEEKDPTFMKPVEGEIIKDYSKDNLIYSNTLQEWTTHLGVDYKAEKTDVVKASTDGTIKSIKNDPRYGLTIVIEHSNGFESIYSSLLTSEFVKVGEQVTQGQTIATVGNTATFEVADETHLHFEIKKDGESVDPNIYIK